MIHKIDHIAIAVNDLEKEIERFRDVLGLSFEGEETVEDQKVRVAFFRCGEITLELMEPTSPDSPIAAFLEKRGGGLHHIAFSTGDIKSELAGLKSKEIRQSFIDFFRQRQHQLHPSAPLVPHGDPTLLLSLIHI